MSTRSQSYSPAWMIFDKWLDNWLCPAFWTYKAEGTSCRVLSQPYSLLPETETDTPVCIHTYELTNVCMHTHVNMNIYEYPHLVNSFFLQVTEDNCIDLHSLSFSTARISFKSWCFVQLHIATTPLKETFFLPSSFPLYLLSFNTYKIN